MSTILAFGDSIVWGGLDLERGGWVQRLRNLIGKETIEIYVYNVGIDSDTSTDLLKRFEFDTKARMHHESENRFLIGIGANDAIFLNNEGKNLVDIKQFEQNLNQIIDLAKKYSNKIAFLEMTPIDDNKLNPIPWWPQGSCKNEFIDKYNKVLTIVCEQKGIPLIQVNKAITTNDLYDGIHPNASGHEKIADIVKEFIDKNWE